MGPQKEINLFLGEKIQTRFQNGFISQTRSLGLLLSHIKKNREKNNITKKKVQKSKKIGLRHLLEVQKKKQPRKPTTLQRSQP